MTEVDGPLPGHIFFACASSTPVKMKRNTCNHVVSPAWQPRRVASRPSWPELMADANAPPVQFPAKKARSIVFWAQNDYDKSAL